MLKKLLFALCLVILGWMVWMADPRLLWQNLLQWNWVLLGCVVVWAFGYILNTMSFRNIILCSGNTELHNVIGWTDTFKLTIGGYALNYVTPFGLLGGEPWRIYHLRKVMDNKSANSAVTYYAMMHILSHILFWLIGLACGFGLVCEKLVDLNVFSIVSVIALVVVLVMGLYRFAVRKGWISSIHQLLQQHPARFGKALLLELASRMVNVVEYLLLMMIVFPDSPLATYSSAYFVVAFSSLFANMLFFSPLQMGTREGGIFLALQTLAPSMPELLPVAVSISFATRIREFAWILIGILIVKLKK